MNRMGLNRIGSCIVFAFLFCACQKDLKESKVASSVANNLQGGGGNKIRLQAEVTGFGDATYAYNEQGLLETWWFGQLNWTLTHEYDDKGRMIRAFIRDGSGTLLNTIVFFYNQQGERYHEIWYAGNSTTISDEVFYTFGNKIIKTESPVQDYQVLSYFDADGSLLKWEYFLSGKLFASSTYTYGHHFKNPYSAIPGLDFAYVFVNGFFYRNKWYSTSETFSLYDLDGNVIFQQPQDGSKTVAIPGPQNYVVTTDFWDLVFEYYINFSFTYENCGQCGVQAMKSIDNRMANFLVTTAKGGKKTIAEKLKAL